MCKFGANIAYVEQGDKDRVRKNKFKFMNLLQWRHITALLWEKDSRRASLPCVPGWPPLSTTVESQGCVVKVCTEQRQSADLPLGMTVLLFTWLIRKNSPWKRGVFGKRPPEAQIPSHFVFWEKSVCMSSPNLPLSHPAVLLLLDSQPQAKPLCTPHKAVHILSLAPSLSTQMDNDMDCSKVCPLGGFLCPNVLWGADSIEHGYRLLPTRQ